MLFRRVDLSFHALWFYSLYILCEHSCTSLSIVKFLLSRIATLVPCLMFASYRCCLRSIRMRYTRSVYFTYAYLVLITASCTGPLFVIKSNGVATCQLHRTVLCFHLYIRSPLLLRHIVTAPDITLNNITTFFLCFHSSVCQRRDTVFEHESDVVISKIAIITHQLAPSKVFR